LYDGVSGMAHNTWISAILVDVWLASGVQLSAKRLHQLLYFSGLFYCVLRKILTI